MRRRTGGIPKTELDKLIVYEDVMDIILEHGGFAAAGVRIRAAIGGEGVLDLCEETAGEYV